MDYSQLLSYEDIKTRGYDLKADNQLEQGAFYSIDDAIADFTREIVDSVYNLIESYRGVDYTRKLFEDMQETPYPVESYSGFYNMKKAIKYVLLEQAIFVLDNGDKEALATIDINKYGFSPKAIRKLWNVEVLK